MMSFNQPQLDMCKVPYQTYSRNDKSGPSISDKINDSLFNLALSNQAYVNCNTCASNPANTSSTTGICSTPDLEAFKANALTNIITQNNILRGGPLINTPFTPNHLCAIVPSRPQSCSAPTHTHTCGGASK